MQAFIKDDKVLIFSRYEDREIMKSVGDYRWNKDLKAWEYPIRLLPKLCEYFNLTYDTDVKLALDKQLSKEVNRADLINSANLIKAYTENIIPVVEQYNLHISSVKDLYIHQKQALVIASLFDAYALFMETGTGKTIVAIRLIEQRRVATLVVCPLSVIESVWVSELNKWAPNLTYCNLWAYMKSNGKGLFPPMINIKGTNGYKYYDVYLINFESFKKIPNPEKHFQFIIVDESSKLKAPKTQTTKSFVSIRNKIKYKLIMSGLPAPNDLLEYWGQMCYINEDLFGDNFYRFRNIYFKSGGYGNFLYFPKRGAKEAIMKKVAEQAFFVKKSECLDLPDRTYEIRNIELDDIQKKLYNELLKLNITEFKNHTTLAVNELAKIMKLRQVTAGFTISTEGLAVKISNNKINVLKDFIDDELGQDQQAIIWCQFHFEIKILKELLGDNACCLYGEIPQKEKDFNIKEFQDKKKRFLIAHPKSGGMGLTFVNCSYMIWFSLSYSQEEHSQANDRIYRIGQNNKCTYIYILAKETIDEVIYKALRKKQDLAMSCLEMLKGQK